MKIKLLLLVSTLVLLVGCGTVQKGQPVTTVQPVYRLDPATGLIAHVGDTNITSNEDRWVPDPRLTSTIGAAQALGATGTSIPSPLTPLFAGLSIVATVASGLLTTYARAKNKELTVSNAALAATTTVIEAAENAVALKEAARKAATANGSQDFLHEQVKNL